MAQVHESQRRLAMSKKPQADYATATDTADPTNFVEVEVTDKNFAKVTPQVTDNSEDSTGRDQPTEEFLESWDTERPIDLGISSELIGRILLLFFGQVTTTQPDSVLAPTVYQHVFTPVDPNTTRQLLATTMIEITGAAINRKFPSMCGSQLTMKGDGVKRVEASATFKGSGRETEPSGLVVADMDTIKQTGLHYLFDSQAKLTISDAVTLANATDYSAGGRRMASWQFGLDNKPMLDEGYIPGSDKRRDDTDPTSGAVRTELLFGKREFTASTVVRVLSQSDEHAALLTRKLLDWSLRLRGAKIGATTYYHQLTLEALRVRYNMVDYKSLNGLIYCDVQTKLFDAVGSNPMTATLINTVPSYTS
jgi:hypothetical protein